MTYFSFYPHTQLIRGKRGVSIHDLFNQKLYWFNAPETAAAITCFIAADGNLSACIGHRKPIANLRETSMTTVLHNDLINLSRAETARPAMPTCRGCEFRYGCWACLVRTEQIQGSR